MTVLNVFSTHLVDISVGPSSHSLLNLIIILWVPGGDLQGCSVLKVHVCLMSTLCYMSHGLLPTTAGSEGRAQHSRTHALRLQVVSLRSQTHTLPVWVWALSLLPVVMLLAGFLLGVSMKDRFELTGTWLRDNTLYQAMCVRGVSFRKRSKQR